MLVEAALGDVVDRLTILHIKDQRLDDAARIHVLRERDALSRAWAAEGLPVLHQLPQWSGLLEVNTALWEVEDALRECERRSDFGARFVELARSVYRLNDRRAALKRDVNTALGSRLVEQKGYAPY